MGDLETYPDIWYSIPHGKFHKSGWDSFVHISFEQILQQGPGKCIYRGGGSTSNPGVQTLDRNSVYFREIGRNKGYSPR